jgi:hypothetical protein
MDMVYNSEQYSVVEFSISTDHAALSSGGYEIMDKSMQREFYIDGMAAEIFRKEVTDLIAQSPSMEEIDNFLSQYDVHMCHPMTKH